MPLSIVACLLTPGRFSALGGQNFDVALNFSTQMLVGTRQILPKMSGIAKRCCLHPATLVLWVSVLFLLYIIAWIAYIVYIPGTFSLSHHNLSILIHLERLPSGY